MGPIVPGCPPSEGTRPDAKAINDCTRAILEDRATLLVYAALKEAEEKKAALEDEGASLSLAVLEITPDLTELYRAQMGALAKTLSDVEIIHRASQNLGEFITRITIQYDTELCHTAQIKGKTPNLSHSTDSKTAVNVSSGACSLTLVAGVGFEPTTFRL